MSLPQLPPAPVGWNKTIADLMKESSVGWPETEWALEYERSLLPAETRFPRKGDIYAAKEPVRVTLGVTWRSPVTTDVQYVLPAGSRVRIESDSQERPVTVNALPVEYKAVEKAALSLWTRLRPGYGGYYLSLGTSDLNLLFTLVSSDA